MKKQKRNFTSSNSFLVVKYVGLGIQIVGALLLSFWLGQKVDAAINSFPLISCILPILVLVGLFIKIYKETQQNQPKNRDHESEIK